MRTHIHPGKILAEELEEIDISAEVFPKGVEIASDSDALG
jgi:hypothetical protein